MVYNNLVTQSEQERSCILLVRLRTKAGGWIWCHVVLQVKENGNGVNGVTAGTSSSSSSAADSSNNPVIVCTNQILSEREAQVMRANSWLYQFYSLHSKMHYGLASSYDGHAAAAAAAAAGTLPPSLASAYYASAAAAAATTPMVASHLAVASAHHPAAVTAHHAAHTPVAGAHLPQVHTSHPSSTGTSLQSPYTTGTHSMAHTPTTPTGVPPDSAAAPPPAATSELYEQYYHYSQYYNNLRHCCFPPLHVK